MPAATLNNVSIRLPTHASSRVCQQIPASGTLSGRAAVRGRGVVVLKSATLGGVNRNVRARSRVVPRAQARAEPPRAVKQDAAIADMAPTQLPIEQKQILQALTTKSSDEQEDFTAGSDPNASPVSPQQLIGGTPILDLSAYSLNPNVKILAKTEYLNPSGSIKDRIAQHMIANAERTGRLRPGMTVVAATSGNTGSAIAMTCALRGYEYIVITNEKTSKEKVDSMRAYGGEVMISPSGVAPDDPLHYQNIENRLCEENPETYYGVDQYNNPFNAEAYEATLGPEIWKQTAGEVTHFIAGGSTGGTVSGTGRYLKSQNPKIRVLMADPRGSVFWDHVVNGVAAEDVKGGSWETEGVGKDSIPGCFDINVVDGMVRATDEHAFRTCREVAANDGLLIGGSSGLNLHAARVLSGQVEDGATIVTVLPDSGIKYLSKIYNDDWLSEMGVKTTALCEEGQACGDLYWKPAILDQDSAGNAALAFATAATEGSDLWPEEQLDTELAYLLELAPQLADYHKASVSGKERVHSRLQSPAELAATFLEAGAELELKQGADPVDMDGIKRAVHAVMDNSVRSSHPLFLNQLYSGIDPVALAAEWLASTLNANVHTFEVAPVLTEIEKAVLAKTARMWLAPGLSGTTPSHDGLIVPGGSLANMYSMIVARDKAEPEARNKGHSGKLVAFCSEQSHYSYRKAAMVMGLGMDNMIKVACDENGAMIAAELEKEVEAAKARGMTPFYAGTTAGSTVLGAFDDFHGAADVCQRHDMWMHVDGAWGGAAALSQAQRKFLDGFERADSFCWNPHKMLGLPLQCSIFVTRHEGSLSKANGVQADYLFQPDKNNAGADLGDRSIQCGRKADALKIWLSWKARGDDGFGALVDRAFGLAKTVEGFVREKQETDGSFVLAAHAQCANVGFWYVPPRLRPFDPKTATPTQFAEIGFVAPKLKDRMQRAGDAMIGFQPIDSMNKPNFFRLVLPNPRHLSKDNLRDMLDRMDELGKDL